MVSTICVPRNCPTRAASSSDLASYRYKRLFFVRKHVWTVHTALSSNPLELVRTGTELPRNKKNCPERGQVSTEKSRGPMGPRSSEAGELIRPTRKV